MKPSVFPGPWVPSVAKTHEAAVIEQTLIQTPIDLNEEE
jgi:hypothetical protein